MAMKLGGEYHVDKISIKNFEQLADEIGLAKSGLRQRVIEFTDLVMNVLESIQLQNEIENSISELIKDRCLRILR